MVVSSTPEKIPHDHRSIVSVGSFDGVHRAHQQILQALVTKARDTGGRSVLVTFDPHPQNVLRPDHPLGLHGQLRLAPMARRSPCGGPLPGIHGHPRPGPAQVGSPP